MLKTVSLPALAGPLRPMTNTSSICFIPKLHQPINLGLSLGPHFLPILVQLLRVERFSFFFCPSARIGLCPPNMVFLLIFKLDNLDLTAHFIVHFNFSDG